MLYWICVYVWSQLDHREVSLPVVYLVAPTDIQQTICILKYFQHRSRCIQIDENHRIESGFTAVVSVLSSYVYSCLLHTYTYTYM